MDQEKPKSAFRAALAHRDFRWLLTGFAISSMGDWLYGIALIVFVYDRTGSAGWVSAASILRLLPYVLLGPLAGVVADRFDRRTIMLLSDVARGALMMVLAGIAFADASVALAIGVVFLATAAGTPYGPAVQAALPSVLGEEDLAAGNAAVSTIEQVALVVGPMIGGLLLVLGSEPALAFAINGATFFASAGFVLLVRRQAQVTGSASERPPSLGKRLAEGVRAITGSADVMTLVALVVGSTFVYGLELVLLVLVAEELLGTGSEGLAFLNAAVGLGGVGAAILIGRISNDPRQGRVLAVAVVALGIPLALLSIVTDPVVAYLLMTVEGAGSIVLEVVAITMLQRSVAQEVTGRVFGVLDSVLVAAILAGSVLAPIMVGAFGLRVTLVAAGALLPLSALLMTSNLGRLDARARTRRDELAPLVEMLESLGVFDGAPRQSLEMIAGSLHQEHVAAGSTIVREGEPADDFYVVRSGTLEVLAAGEAAGPAVKVNTLGPNDYFGEIGLLEGVPRTATVRAETDCDLYRIDGTTFLDVINQSPSMSGTLLDGIVGRLARTHPSHEPKHAGPTREERG
ncbi:MAG: MFS transporter [Actinomycetota bacterium]|nr:MFS transporter [Actinomycetota bacterium]